LRFFFSSFLNAFFLLLCFSFYVFYYADKGQTGTRYRRLREERQGLVRAVLQAHELDRRHLDLPPLGASLPEAELPRPASLYTKLDGNSMENF
jgi:hypothetical protein